MTWPVTPDPGIHQPGRNSAVLQQQLAGATQIQMWAQRLLAAFTTDLINAILGALGLGAFTGPIDGAFSQLETALQNTLGGLLPAVIDNLNGTSTVIGSLVTDLENGTSSFLDGVGGFVNTLFDSGGGTSMPLSTLLANFSGSVGTFAAGINQALTGAESAGVSVAQTIGGIPNAIGQAISGLERDFTVLESQLQVSNLAATVNATSASVTQLVNNAAAAVNSGLNAVVNF